MNWLEALQRARLPAVVVTVAGADGSTPREAGTKMVVTEDGAHGTIGGGHLELNAIEEARGLLSSPGTRGPQFRRFSLGPSLGQCCGGVASLVLERVDAPLPDWIAALGSRLAAGETLVLATAVGAASPARRLIARSDAGCVAGVDALPARLRESAGELLEGQGPAAKLLAEGPQSWLLLERHSPPAFHVMLFGAGHVGQALVRVLAQLPCSVTWIDDRESQFPEEVFPNVKTELSDEPESEVDAAPPGTYFLVMTHSHALDQRICERIFRRDDFAYFGLIGSKNKRMQFERRLAERGVDPRKFALLTCPIGIAGLKGKDPGSIAVAVAAQLLQLRESASMRIAAATAL